MSAETQLDMDVQPEAAPWYCRIHGTVRRCPFKWMTCDVGPCPEEQAKSQPSDWQEELSSETSQKRK